VAGPNGSPREDLGFEAKHFPVSECFTSKERVDLTPENRAESGLLATIPIISRATPLALSFIIFNF
jgi:hypothetical protein